MARSWTAAELIEAVRAFQPACVITAATDLDVFTVLDGQAMTALMLAARVGGHPRATTILLDALVALELLEKDRDFYAVPRSVADLLSEKSPVNIVPCVRHHANCLRRWVQLAQVVKAGKPATRTSSVRGPQADGEAFVGAMNTFNLAAAPSVVARLGPLAFQRLLDIGGASGTWTIAFLLAAREATAVLFDLPEVIPLAQERLTAAHLIDRVTLVPGDYDFDELPAGADLAWLSAVAHQNSREQNCVLFAKIHAALAPAGALVIRDVVMDVSRTRPTMGALFAVNMLVGTEAGNTYTFAEYRDDLTRSGFADIELLHQDEGMSSLVRAIKA
jgi:predicted O-methyltransferase YrrM